MGRGLEEVSGDPRPGGGAEAGPGRGRLAPRQEGERLAEPWNLQAAGAPEPGVSSEGGGLALAFLFFLGTSTRQERGRLRQGPCLPGSRTVGNKADPTTRPCFRLSAGPALEL